MYNNVGLNPPAVAYMFIIPYLNSDGVNSKNVKLVAFLLKTKGVSDFFLRNLTV